MEVSDVSVISDADESLVQGYEVMFVYSFLLLS